MSDETRISIPVDPRKPGLFSYVHVWEPQVDKTTKNESYSLSLLWSKSDKATTKMVREAIAQALEDGNEGGFKGKKMSEKQMSVFEDSEGYPLKDGDDKDDELYEGKWYVSARSKTRPGVVDKRVDDITDKSELYSGCLGKISATFYPYNWEGKLGIGVALNNIQVLKQGDPIGSNNRKPQDDFGKVDLGDDDDDDYKPKKKKSKFDDDDDDYKPKKKKSIFDD